MPSLTRPSADRVAGLLAAVNAAAPTHPPGGLDGPGDRAACRGPLRTGHKTDLGRGDRAFAAARAVLRRWGQFPEWAAVHGPGGTLPPPPVEDDAVCVVARGGGVWWANPCRIYEVIDTPDCFSVAYTTLPGHVCRGEERFRLTRGPEGRVWYDVRADSELAHPLAKLAGPLVRRKQCEFARDSLAVLRKAVRTAGVTKPDSAADLPRVPAGLTAAAGY